MSSSSRCTSPALAAEPWPDPDLHAAVTNTVVAVMRSDGVVQEQQVFLASSSQKSNRFVYQRIVNKRSIPLGNNRGQVVFCVAFPQRTNTNGQEQQVVYQEPRSEKEAILVAVKETRKEFYCPQRKRMISVRDANENPYHEVAAMRHVQNCVDNDCVMKCLDALETDSHLYIVTPYSDGGDLYYQIPWVQLDRPRRRSATGTPSSSNSNIAMGLPSQQVKTIFKRIVHSVSTLHQCGVCHRDLKNENFVLDTSAQTMNPVIIDLAMSLKVPRTRNGCHKIYTDGGRCGTLFYMPPEVFDERVVRMDGFQVDVWCLGMTLFCLLTGRYLYKIPHTKDLMYKHFVALGGFTNDTLNNQWRQRGMNMIREQLQQSNNGSRKRRDLAWVAELLNMIGVVQQLDDSVRDLLQGMLHAGPLQRMTLTDVQQHPWLA